MVGLLDVNVLVALLVPTHEHHALARRWVTSTGGLLLGVPILLTVVAFAWEVLRRLRQDEGSIWWIRMGAITGMIAIAMQAAVEFSLQMPGNAAFFAVIAGLAIHDGRRL